MEKTAMKNLIEEIESVYNLKEEESEQTKTLKWVVQQIKNRYIEQERNQIIESYNSAYTGAPFPIGSVYFSQNYQSDK